MDIRNKICFVLYTCIYLVIQQYHSKCLQACTIHYRDDFIQGYEVPVLVLFCSPLTAAHNDNVFSRCQSQLIVICDGEQAKEIVKHSKKGAIAVDVYGELNLA
jgi:hypothetical protein